MSQFPGLTIFWTIFIIIGTCFLLKDLNIPRHHGKFIVKLKENRGSHIFWVVLLIIFGILLWFNIRDYIHYKEGININNILQIIIWMELSILNIIKSLKSSEIRENGIYISGYFYKWAKIRSYSWILPNKIQFKVKTFFEIDRSFEISIKEEFRLNVDEILRKFNLNNKE